MALASLGTTTSDDHDSSASESSQWSSSSEEIGLTQSQSAKDASARRKRKVDELEEGEHKYPGSIPTMFTWPSLEFSSSLNPLEVRLNIGSGGSHSKCQVTVAQSVADILPKTGGWEPELPSRADKATSSPCEDVSDDHLEIQWSTQEYSQNSDWRNHGSQASSFFFEELSDSQMSLPSSW